MHITDEMINEEIRGRGKFFRRFMPYYKIETFYRINRILRFTAGRHTRKMNCEEVMIDSHGRSIRLCVYSPKEKKENVPGILWIHGGGYAIETPELDEAFIQRFVNSSGAIVVSPDYTLSTILPYPAALEDCYSALLWLKNHAKDLGVRPNQLMVGGDSAGGGLAAAISIYSRDKNEVAIAFQMPLYPMLDDRMITESSQDNDAPVWNTISNINAWKLYLRDLYGTDNVQVYASPSRLLDFSNLPPAVTYVGSIEAFRDETIDYMEKLKAEGIYAKYRVYDGCFHAFDILGGKSSLGKDAVNFLKEEFKYAVKHFFAEQPQNEAQNENK